MTAPTTDTVFSLDTLQAAAESLTGQVISWRRHLHTNPEVSFHEHATAQYIHDVLSNVRGLQLSKPTATSVVARLVGALPGRVIAVRADIDALPIDEENDIPYRSQTRGAMHACGHDGHTAIVLALATLLAAHRDELPGEVRFVFQHAEELSPGGAEELVNAGVMDGVDEVIGLHLWASMPVGRIGLISGPAMAAPDTFQCTITGQGGHAAIPHDTIDPIAIGAQVVTALQQVISRQVDPLDPCVLSITQFIAGTAFNVIPQRVVLKGTVRTLSPQMRAMAEARFNALAEGTALAFGAIAQVSYLRGYPVTVNAATETDHAAAAARAVSGGCDDAPFVMGGEDFAYMLQERPGAYILMGNGDTAMVHHPEYNFNDEAIPAGCSWWAEMAERRMPLT